MLSLAIAWRFLRKSPTQSILIAVGIAVGIGVQVFTGSLITSLQSWEVQQTIGHSPQVSVVSPKQGTPVDYTSSVQQAMKSDASIEHIVPSRSFPGVFRVGAVAAPLQLIGGPLPSLNTIYDISGRMVAGTASLSPDQVLLGKEFAARYGVKPGDKLVLVLPNGTSRTLTVPGIFDFGSAAANLGTGFVNGDFAGTVLKFSSSQYTSIDSQVANVFDSKTVAAGLARQPALQGLKVTEWQTQNADLLSALQSEGMSSYLIQFFVLVAVALGIASTLAISAVQKTRQIGILKAMGMKDRQAGRVFLWQALMIGVTGAALGVGVGIAIIALFNVASKNSAGSFPISPQVTFVVISFVVGVLVAMLASLVPSRRTSKLDPIEVIQNG